MKEWRQFEAQVARDLNGRRLVNVRPGKVCYVSLPDVELSRHPELKIDCKHTARSFSHHRLLEKIGKKYCVLERDEPVLVTREGNDPNWVVSIRGEFFVRLLESKRRAQRYSLQFPGPHDTLVQAEDEDSF